MLPLIDEFLVHYVVGEALASGVEQGLFVTDQGKRRWRMTSPSPSS